MKTEQIIAKQKELIEWYQMHSLELPFESDEDRRKHNRLHEELNVLESQESGRDEIFDKGHCGKNSSVNKLYLPPAVERGVYPSELKEMDEKKAEELRKIADGILFKHVDCTTVEYNWELIKDAMIEYASLFQSKQEQWTNDKVIDFVNWFIHLHKIDERFELENQNIIDSFLNGDDYKLWWDKLGEQEQSKTVSDDKKDRNLTVDEINSIYNGGESLTLKEMGGTVRTKICHIGFDCESYNNRSNKECTGCEWWY